MLNDDTRLSLADLAAAGVRLGTCDAVTIARALLLKVASGDIPGVPSAHVIRLSRSGELAIEGPVAAGGRAVSRAAQLLESLLPSKDGGPEFKVPGALRLCIVRALGALDVPPYPSLESFADALQRFSAPDPSATIRGLVESWSTAVASTAAARAVADDSSAADRLPDEVQAPAPAPPAAPGILESASTSHAAQSTPHVAQSTPHVAHSTSHAHGTSHDARRTSHVALRASEPLSISDIRRARRATGLPLAQISQRSRIPVPLLRQLEWGYLLNWPSGLYGRTQLVRYARAAGLDEQIVIATVWPMLDEVERERPEMARHDVPAPDVAIPMVTAPMVTAPMEPAPIETAPIVTAPIVAAPIVAAGSTTVDAGEMPLVHEPVVEQPAATGGTARSRLRAGVAAVAALAAMLLLVMVPLVWDRSELPSLTIPWRTTGTTGTDAADRTAPASSRGDAPQATGSSAEASNPPRTNPTDSQPVDVARNDPPQRQDVERVPDPPEAQKTARTEPVPAAGAEPARGLTDAETAWSPTFASTGSAMFYHAQDKDSSALMRADTDGEGAILRITRVVDDNAQNYHARPSPNGSLIAFDSDRDGERGVYLADADGSNVRRVSGKGHAAVPSWSPDGQTLAVVRAEPDRPKVWNIWTIDLATGDTSRLTSHRYGQPWGASWFPDGRRIAYSHEFRLVILDLGTGRERAFASPRKGRVVRTPAVSPDGRRIIFQVAGDGAWLLDLDDGSMRKILADPSAEEYTWSPDGRRVAYHSRRTGEWGVWLMAAR